MPRETSVADKEDSKTKLYELIDDVKIAMLTTVEAGGRLHTRPMGNQKADPNGDIWFFTEKNGAVADNLKTSPKVSLGYSNASSTYVAVSGTGQMVHDKGKIDELWSEDLKAWFPQGKDDPNVALLKVMPERGEFWDTGSNRIVSAVGYLKAKITGEAADDMVDNRKVAL